MKPGMRLKASDTIVFIGDSITDAEHHRQAYKPLGYGYVHFVGNLLWARHPELNLSVVNTGVSGDTICDAGWTRRVCRCMRACEKKFLLIDTGIARTKRNATMQTSIFLIFSPLHVTGFSLVCRYLF